MDKDKEIPFSQLRGSLKERVLIRLRQIREKFATKFEKVPPSPGSRMAKFKTIKEPKEKLYGALRIAHDQGKTFIVYSILKGWEYQYAPNELDDKGKPLPNATPIMKNPKTEEIVEEVR